MTDVPDEFVPDDPAVIDNAGCIQCGGAVRDEVKFRMPDKLDEYLSCRECSIAARSGVYQLSHKVHCPECGEPTPFRRNRRTAICPKCFDDFSILGVLGE